MPTTLPPAWIGNATSVSGGGKTLANLRTTCEYHGWHDTTTAGLAALDDFINDTLAILAMLVPWPEYHKRDGSAAFTSGDDAEELDEGRIVRIGTVVRDDRAAELDEITIDEWLHHKKYHSASGSPTCYALRKYTTAGLEKMEMVVYPNPSANITLYYTYQISPLILVSAGDTTDWPTSRRWLLSDALRTRVAAIDRDIEGAVLYGAEFMTKVNRAFAHARPSYKPIVAKPMPVGKRKMNLGDIEKTFI